MKKWLKRLFCKHWFGADIDHVNTKYIGDERTGTRIDTPVFSKTNFTCRKCGRHIPKSIDYEY